MPDEIEAITCVICGSRSEKEKMYICDNCGCGTHVKCLGEPIEPPYGYFFCKDCDH